MACALLDGRRPRAPSPGAGVSQLLGATWGCTRPAQTPASRCRHPQRGRLQSSLLRKEVSREGIHTG